MVFGLSLSSNTPAAILLQASSLEWNAVLVSMFMQAHVLEMQVYVSVYADGPTRVLRFADAKSTALLEAEQSILDLAARLKQVRVSTSPSANSLCNVATTMQACPMACHVCLHIGLTILRILRLFAFSVGSAKYRCARHERSCAISDAGVVNVKVFSCPPRRRL